MLQVPLWNDCSYLVDLCYCLFFKIPFFVWFLVKFQATKLEADIEMMRKELEEPTEVEIELKRRLNQLTDHLIQKQSQVDQHLR